MFIKERSHLLAEFSSFSTTWMAPSNIAIVKYWGKKGEQLPANPSFSFTLDQSVTKTKVEFVKSDKASISIFLGEEKREDFVPKIKKLVDRISLDWSFLKKLSLKIETQNTFPHSTGIASSASGMAALALCLVSLEKELFPQNAKTEDFMNQASCIARLGSGSACRSLFSNAAYWGEDGKLGHDEIARPYQDLHPIYQNLHDAILIVTAKEKSVSSRAGHGLMKEHAFAKARFCQARKNWERLQVTLKQDDFSLFAKICEEEALSLHAMMMTSNPGYLLFAPSSLLLIEKIRGLRNKGYEVCFTMDAGPNIHLFYPDRERQRILPIIKSELLPLCENGSWIDDHIGTGPKEIR